MRSLIINGFAFGGLRITNSDQNLVVGNWLALDNDGVTALPNLNGLQLNSASSNMIGDGWASGRNVIGGTRTSSSTRTARRTTPSTATTSART